MARHRGQTSPCILTGCVAASPIILSANRFLSAVTWSLPCATPSIFVQCRAGVDDDVMSLEVGLAVAVDDELSIEAGDAMSTLEFAVDDESSIKAGDAISTLEFAADDESLMEAGDAMSTLEFAVDDESSIEAGDAMSALVFADDDVVSTAAGDAMSTIVAAATGDPRSACVVFFLISQVVKR